MIQIDAGMVAIIITVLISLLGLAVAWGTLWEKVRRNRKDIDKMLEENSAEHRRIYDKIEEVKEYLINGRIT